MLGTLRCANLKAKGADAKKKTVPGRTLQQVATAGTAAGTGTAAATAAEAVDEVLDDHQQLRWVDGLR